MSEDFDPDFENDMKKEREFLNTVGKDKINPSHYYEVIPGKQYMELMDPMLERFKGVEAHFMGQTYKYLMRLGNKDEKIQDAEKAHWYLTELINYYKNGKVNL